MKEICHKGFARLVGTYGALPMEPEALEIIINASVEPDQIDKEIFSKNVFYGAKWLYNHTIGAKELAVNYLRNAYDAHASDESSWLRELGFVFHFITDWATPQHSLNSNSNLFTGLTKTGAQLGGAIGGISEPDKDSSKKLKGSLIGGGILGLIGLVAQQISHSRFESRCDKRWEKNTQLVTEFFIEKAEKAENNQLPEQIDLALDLFDKKMNNLRQLCEKLPFFWIDRCDNEEYANYMVEIALVLNFACQIITMNNGDESGATE
ncbi:MAG: hypothetical protein ACTSP6_04015 [Promethearchaeota archaeon]